MEAAHSSLRWAVTVAADVHELGSCRLPVRIVDISTSGCRLWAGFHLNPGRSARLLIADFVPLRCRVVWAREWYAALRFDAGVHPSVLRHLVDRYQPGVPDEPSRRVASMIAPSTP